MWCKQDVVLGRGWSVKSFYADRVYLRAVFSSDLPFGGLEMGKDHWLLLQVHSAIVWWFYER